MLNKSRCSVKAKNVCITKTYQLGRKAKKRANYITNCKGTKQKNLFIRLKTSS